jgi:hypothetical protein
VSTRPPPPSYNQLQAPTGLLMNLRIATMIKIHSDRIQVVTGITQTRTPGLYIWPLAHAAQMMGTEPFTSKCSRMLKPINKILQLQSTHRHLLVQLTHFSSHPNEGEQA